MNFKIRRHLVIGLVFMFIISTVMGCGTANNEPKNTSPEGAAQVFVKAISALDYELLNLINKTDIPTDLMLQEAPEIGWTGRSYTEFEYKITQSEEDERFYNAVITDPENELSGELTIKIMKFPDGKYYFVD